MGRRSTLSDVETVLLVINTYDHNGYFARAVDECKKRGVLISQTHFRRVYDCFLIVCRLPADTDMEQRMFDRYSVSETAFMAWRLLSTRTRDEGREELLARFRRNEIEWREDFARHLDAYDTDADDDLDDVPSIDDLFPQPDTCFDIDELTKKVEQAAYNGTMRAFREIAEKRRKG